MSDDTAPDFEVTGTAGAPKGESTEFFESLQPSADFYAAPHRTLQHLSDSADAGGSGAGIPITLFLHGGMVAGHITSSQSFYRDMADLYREGVANATADGKLPEYVDAVAKMFFESAADDADRQIADDVKAFEDHGIKTSRWILTRHIFLKDAYYTVPGAQSVRRDRVCIQLSQVVGWALGVTTWG